MNPYEYHLEKVNLSSSKEKDELESFLNESNLSFEKDIELALIIRGNNQQIVATGSIANKVLKCFAVCPDLQGEGLASHLVSELIHLQKERGYQHFFVFTKADNTSIFEGLGFYKIAEVLNKVSFLENTPSGLSHYLEEIKVRRTKGAVIGGIVVNCNPFTRGHLYLIEKASQECDFLHLFVVWENASAFPNEIRFDLVRKGTAHLRNIVLHQGGDYIISKATFPSYFLKTNSEITETHAELDLSLFADHIAPILGINKRFVGEEPYCPVTSIYNKIMKEFLPKKGISVYEIPRLTMSEEIISASKVRKLIAEGKMKETKEMLPQSTWDFLQGQEACSIIEKLKTTASRH